MSDTWNHEADAWDSLAYADIYDEDVFYPKLYECKYCHQKGLVWRILNGNWRLYKPINNFLTFELHSCAR